MKNQCNKNRKWLFLVTGITLVGYVMIYYTNGPFLKFSSHFGNHSDQSSTDKLAVLNNYWHASLSTNKHVLNIDKQTKHALQSKWLIKTLDRNYINEVDEYLFDTSEKVLIPFLPHYANPCWYSYLDDNVTTMYEGNNLGQTRRKFTKQEYIAPLIKYRDNHLIPRYNKDLLARQIRCLPKVYIIGTAKSGTTDLFWNLAKHPQIFPGRMKEYHWWNKARQGLKLKGNVTVPLNDYVESFDIAAYNIQNSCPGVHNDYAYHPCLTMEGSPSTFWCPVINRMTNMDGHRAEQNYNLSVLDSQDMIPSYMYRLQPGAKLILILRNPVSRLYSDYHFFKREDRDGEKRPDLFHSETLRSIELLTNCTRSHPLKWCIYNKKLRNTMQVRLMLNIYYMYLEEWLKAFPSEQLLVLKFEEYASADEDYYREITEFLALDPYPKKVVEKMIEREPRNSHSNSSSKAMWKSTQRILEEFFRPYNDVLAFILKDNRFRWL